MPFHKVESRDGILHGGVTDVGSTRLDGPPKVLSDPTRVNQIAHPQNTFHCWKNRDVQISQCSPEWWSSRVSEYYSSVDIPEVDHP